MFNRGSAGPTTTASYSAEKSVAELLSSLASGNYSSSVSTSSVGIMTPTSLVSGFGCEPSAITPLLTPTTLASFEQMIELHNDPSNSTATDLSMSRESGFVPPLVQPLTSSASSGMPVKQEYEGYNMFRNSMMNVKDEDPDWEPSGKRQKLSAASYLPMTTSAANLTLPAVTPNATVTSTGTHRPSGPRSRKPHVQLTPEETERKSMRRERNKQAAAKCRQRRVDLTNTLLNESEDLEEDQARLEDEIQALQQQKEQLEFLLQAHRPLCPKKFPSDSAASCAAVCMQRPTSLPITMPRISEATGIPISTPSTGVFNFGLEAMLDGHTGLTPVTDGPSCASQVQRTTSLDGGSSSSDALSSPTLMAL